MNLTYRLPYVIIVILLLLIAFQPIPYIGFSRPDDSWMLLDIALVHPEKFTVGYLGKVFNSFNSLQYSPLNTLYYYIVYKVNGYDPYWFHLGSFIIHSANVLLVYIAVKKLLNALQIADGRKLAYLICLVWAIHPLNVESVVWISASKIVLFSFWGLLSFILFMNYYVNKRKYAYWLCLLTFTLSFFCKEQAVVFPLLYMAFQFFYDRKHSSKISFKKYVHLIPFFVISLLGGLITIKALNYAVGNNPLSNFPFSQRVILSFYCLCFYVFNSILPLNLHYHYSFPIQPGNSLPFIFYAFPVGLVAIAGFFFYSIRKLPYFNILLFGVVLFLLHIFLCIQITPLTRPAIMADRYMYLPAIGLLLSLITLLHFKLKKVSTRGKSWYRYLPNIIFTLYIIALAGYSNVLTFNWMKLNI